MEQRKRRTAGEMFPVMARYESSGLSQGTFCAEADLPRSVFQYWWRRYREASVESADGGGFVELRSAASAEGIAGLSLELQLGNGAVLRFRGGLPPSDYVVGLLQELSRC